LKSEIKRKKKYGLVMLGGNTNKKLIEEIIISMEQKNNLIIVTKKKIDFATDYDDMNIKYVHDPSNLENLIAESSWCISNGGITMLEMIFLRKVIYSFPQNHNEVKLANKMYDEGLIFSVDPSKIDISDSIDYTPKKNEIFDGLGARNIVNEIVKIVYK